MAHVSETLPLTSRLQLALQLSTPSRLAQTFASHCGQFYDRRDFDGLARRVSALYNNESAEQAHIFRTQLDRRLCDRDRGPVAWEVTNGENRAA